MIKTFRGKLLQDTENTIRLSTKKGKIGYKIIKFQVIGQQPAVTAQEATCKIYKVTQSSIDSAIDFSDGNLLGVALWSSDGNLQQYPEDMSIIFDRETFNQDIFITNKGSADTSVNYYLELETSTLSDNAAAVSTLRDIRLNPQKHA